jgi:hypothetical protein
LLEPGVKAGQIVAWKEDFELGHGHAMAIYAVLKPLIPPKPTKSLICSINDRVRLLSPEPVGWIQHHQLYSSVGADIVMESITLKPSVRGEQTARACDIAWLRHSRSAQAYVSDISLEVARAQPVTFFRP